MLGLDTTRGDRLFISLLGSAFIHLAWLGLVGPNLWWALGLSLIYASACFDGCEADGEDPAARPAIGKKREEPYEKTVYWVRWRRLPCMAPSASWADMAAAEKWVDSEFQPSTLSREDQLKEMQWFIDAAKPFAGMEINVLSEGRSATHDYESTVLTKAFEEITGIKVNHQELGEGEVVQAVQTQMQTNRNLYDAYINDSDLIGTHSRLQSAVNLTDWMAGEGKDVTNPMLDLDDFIGKSFTTGPDGKLWQLPDQQFANLYWFRKDWFDRADLQGAVQGQVRLRPRRAGQLVGL